VNINALSKLGVIKEMDVDKVQMMHYTWNPKVGDFYKRKGFVPFELSYVKNMKEEENGT